MWAHEHPSLPEGLFIAEGEKSQCSLRVWPPVGDHSPRDGWYPGVYEQYEMDSVGFQKERGAGEREKEEKT